MAALTAALLAATAASTYSQFKGQRNAANAAIAQGNYVGGVQDVNAGYADQQALDAERRGVEGAQRVDTQTRTLVGSQRAALAASGVDANVGSGAEIQGETQALGALDELTIKNNAAREAFGYKVEAQNYRSGAQFARAGAQNAAQSYRNQSWATLLGGGLQVAGMFPSNSLKVPSTPKTDLEGGITAVKRAKLNY